MCLFLQISVHLFLTDGGAYGGGGGASSRGGFGGWCDVPTLALIPKATGGGLHFFPAALKAPPNQSAAATLEQPSLGANSNFNFNLSTSVAAAVVGQFGTVLTAVAANETVLKVLLPQLTDGRL
jgi:hypothetical protein